MAESANNIDIDKHNKTNQEGYIIHIIGHVFVVHIKADTVITKRLVIIMIYPIKIEVDIKSKI